MTVLQGAEGFLFGCDPEMFVTDAEGNLVGAAGLLPGTKQEPHKVEYGAVQVDGMAAEFNITPVDNFVDWNRNIVAVVKQLKAMLPKGYGLKVAPAVRFSEQVMAAQPDSAKMMGCDPDYNAWTGAVNPYPDTLSDPLLRTASGHVHIGWTEDMPVTDELHVMHGRDLVKQLDWYLGAWSVLKDPDVTRRQLYGKAGAFRPKPYGVEYRVMSNFWIREKDTRRLVWNRLQDAIIRMKSNEMSKKYKPHSEFLQTFINEGRDEVHLVSNFNYPIARAA